MLLQVNRPLASFGKKYGCLDLICSRKIATIMFLLLYLWWVYTEENWNRETCDIAPNAQRPASALLMSQCANMYVTCPAHGVIGQLKPRYRWVGLLLSLGNAVLLLVKLFREMFRYEPLGTLSARKWSVKWTFFVGKLVNVKLVSAQPNLRIGGKRDGTAPWAHSPKKTREYQELPCSKTTLLWDGSNNSKTSFGIFFCPLGLLIPLFTMDYPWTSRTWTGTFTWTSFYQVSWRFRRTSPASASSTGESYWIRWNISPSHLPIIFRPKQVTFDVISDWIKVAAWSRAVQFAQWDVLCRAPRIGHLRRS